MKHLAIAALAICGQSSAQERPDAMALDTDELYTAIRKLVGATPTIFSSFEKSPPDHPVISSGKAGVPSFMSDPCVIRDKEG